MIVLGTSHKVESIKVFHNTNITGTGFFGDLMDTKSLHLPSFHYAMLCHMYYRLRDDEAGLVRHANLSSVTIIT